jgi:hypothetical protein
MRRRDNCRASGDLCGEQFIERENTMSFVKSLTGLRILSAAAILAALPLVPHPASADGAIAVGVPADVSKDGYAYGRNIDSSNSQTASDHALNNCRTAKDASQQARELCLVVMTFRNKCVSLALDPDAGTPGAGWAIANTKQEAIDQAMAQCLATAGPNRRDHCKTSDAACDGGDR